MVPMISGRGLGHTGGTLDKLESIPGYRRQPDNDAVPQGGCARSAAPSSARRRDLAPADRRLYAIRDVTATVESIPLITASILSKKLAAGLDALVMDVNFGNGAFMTDLGRAEELARSIVDGGRGAGLRTDALLTDMNQVLGRTAGNALEVREAIDWLTGASDDPRLTEVVLALGAEMLVLGGLADDLESATGRLVAARADGTAAERFQQMVDRVGWPAGSRGEPDGAPSIGRRHAANQPESQRLRAGRSTRGRSGWRSLHWAEDACASETTSTTRWGSASSSGSASTWTRIDQSPSCMHVPTRRRRLPPTPSLRPARSGTPSRRQPRWSPRASSG